MKIVKLYYQVRAEFIEENKKNVEAVMEDLKVHPILGMHYHSFYLGEGKFMHINQSRSDKTTAQLGQRDAFNFFRRGLRKMNLIQMPEIEYLEQLGTNNTLI